jgi:putative oxidoreductase
MNGWRTDTAGLVLRVASGLIFIPHGVSKVFGSGGVANFAQSLPSYGIPTALGYVAAYSELICGTLLILGLLTRLDALLLAGTMFVAAFVISLPDVMRDPDAAGKNKLFAAIRGMELPLSVLAAMIALLLLGGGRFSLDALIFRRCHPDAERSEAEGSQPA